MLDRASHGALVLGGKAGVFAGKDLTRVRDVADHLLWSSERNFRGRRGLGLLFGGGHDRNGGLTVCFEDGMSTGISSIVQWSQASL